MIMPESHECLGLDSRRGFAMLVVLVVLVALSAGAMFFVYGAGDERLIGRSMREAGQAFYAAEAGVNDIVAVWDLEKYHLALTSSGDSTDLGWTPLGGGPNCTISLAGPGPDSLRWSSGSDLAPLRNTILEL